LAFGLIPKDSDGEPYRPDHCNDRRYCGRQKSLGWFVSVGGQFSASNCSSLKYSPPVQPGGHFSQD
jgi:hypothetical protein